MKNGVTNVSGDLGLLFAYGSTAEPRPAAALMGTLVKGLGADHVIWGTDAVWTGTPQWQIEESRRLEILEDMPEEYGFAPLGDADGAVKRGIFAENRFRTPCYEHHAELPVPDRFAAFKEQYLREGANPSNLRYGYVRRA